MLKTSVLVLLGLIGGGSVARAQAPSVGRQNQCSPSTASGTTYACTISGVPGTFALATGAQYSFIADVANTGSATINFNTLGAKTIFKVSGGITTALVANDILAGQIVFLVYTGSNFQMTSPVGNATTGGTVTSVSWTGGIVTVASPTTAPAFTIAGNSGGVPYFNSSSTWATSSALSAGQFVLGGGAGAAPATSFSVVPVANGGTATGTLTAHGVLLGQGTSAVSAVAAMAADTFLQGQGATSDPAAVSIGNCANGLTYSTSTHTFGCLGGSPPTVIHGTTTVTAGSIIDGGYYETTFTLSGVVAGEAVMPQWPSDFQAGLFGTMVASATNTIKIRILNMSGSNVIPTAGATYGATVIH